MEKRWFVVYTKSGYEDVVRKELEKQGFETFYPVYQVLNPHRNRAFKRVCPLFPSYLFVSFDPETDRWRSINGTRGVLALVGSGEDFVTPVPVGCVEKLIEKRGPDGFIEIAEAIETQGLKEGEKVEILEGPWLGQVATVFKSAEERVVLLLSLLSGTVRLILNPKTVRRQETNGQR